MFLSGKIAPKLVLCVTQIPLLARAEPLNFFRTLELPRVLSFAVSGDPFSTSSLLSSFFSTYTYNCILHQKKYFLAKSFLISLSTFLFFVHEIIKLRSFVIWLWWCIIKLGYKNISRAVAHSSQWWSHCFRRQSWKYGHAAAFCIQYDTVSLLRFFLGVVLLSIHSSFFLFFFHIILHTYRTAGPGSDDPEHDESRAA